MRPPTWSSAAYTGSVTPARPATTSAAPSTARPSPRSGLPTDAITWAPARAARGAGDEHPAPRERTEPPERPQRGHTSSGDRRRQAEIKLIGHDRELGGVGRPQLGPPPGVAERDHPGAGRRPGAVPGRRDDHPGGVE